MDKWFLYRVYKLNKGLFVFFMVWFSGTIFTTFSGWQATPFFVWGMYSQKEDSSRNYPVLRLTVNDHFILDLSDLTDANKFFITSPLQLYIGMKKSGGDPTEGFLKTKLWNYSAIHSTAGKVLNGSKEYNLFLSWYKRYLEQTTGISINTYKIELLKVSYNKTNQIEIASTELIDTWKQ